MGTMKSSRELGHLTKVDPRVVWAHEAHDFTPWLAANGDRLAEALGIDLELTGSEHPIGAFSLDIVGKDVTHDKPLIVENQLESSDHSHLGQLLTYAAGTGAATIVWLATAIRDEHRQALTWLNEQTGTDIHFFGVELEVVQIGTSVPAPLFNVVVMPNDWQKAVKAAASAGAVTERQRQYSAFWQRFLERINEVRPDWSRARGGTVNSWFPMSVGLPAGCSINACFGQNGRLRHELYIDRPTAEECKALFDHLEAQREQFETAFGAPVEWARLDERKAARISSYTDGTIDNEAEHETYIDWFVDAGDRMRRAVAAVSFE